MKVSISKRTVKKLWELLDVAWSEFGGHYGICDAPGEHDDLLDELETFLIKCDEESEKQKKAKKQ